MNRTHEKVLTMKRFGSRSHLMRPMNENDVFLFRLHLLIVIVKAAMKGYPVGEYRKNAALENAGLVHKMVMHQELSFLQLNSSVHLFRERVKLLSIMAVAIVNDHYPMGIHRREAVSDNIAMIEELVFPHEKMELFDSVLKVA